ncbi:YdcF family protein [Prochlorococcus sp. MIT 1223]|uniref:YdcF family protein n=1 Tax=Prochlorococcus sp. MIT 1223 TaxID=3096217 RepID=UPI002A75FD07|nr:YdcF family protein [Prochlorococcus sp. MIT 1223]
MSYFFSKFLPLFLLPLGLALLLLLLSNRRKNSFKIYTAILILWTFSTGVVANGLWILLEFPWQRLNANQVPSSDAIVVLSGSGINQSPGSNKIIEWADPDRFFAGIDLFKERKASKLLFTGGLSPFRRNLPTEGAFYRKKAIELGIPASDIWVSPIVSNTVQEALAIANLLNPQDREYQPQILLVTSAYHMNRAKWIFERQGLKVNAFPVDFQSRKLSRILGNPLNWAPNASMLGKSSSALREIMGRIIYQIFY